MDEIKGSIVNVERFRIDTDGEYIDAKSLTEETDLTFEEYLEKEGGITLEDFMKKYSI